MPGPYVFAPVADVLNFRPASATVQYDDKRRACINPLVFKAQPALTIRAETKPATEGVTVELFAGDATYAGWVAWNVALRSVLYSTVDGRRSPT